MGVVYIDGCHDGIFHDGKTKGSFFGFHVIDFAGDHAQVDYLCQGVGHAFAGSAARYVDAHVGVQLLELVGPSYNHGIEGKGS